VSIGKKGFRSNLGSEISHDRLPMSFGKCRLPESRHNYGGPRTLVKQGNYCSAQGTLSQLCNTLLSSSVNIFSLTDVRFIGVGCTLGGARVRGALHYHFVPRTCSGSCSVLDLALGSHDCFGKKRLRIVETTRRFRTVP
jgi:hypothetical protein